MTYRTILLAVAAIVGAVAWKPAVAQTDVLSSACVVDQTVDAIQLSPQPPCDIPAGQSPTPVEVARFAWNTFIALNWPAADAFVPPYRRGVPADWSLLADASGPGEDRTLDQTLNYVAIWDSWREKRELFRVGPDPSEMGKFVLVQPEPFNNNRPPSTTGPVSQVGACSDVVVNGHVSALQSNKVENYLDETDEIGLAVVWRYNGALGPQEDTLVRYQVKFNEDHYNYVVDNSYWDPSTLADAVNQQVNSVNGIGIVLPAGSNATAKTGSILVKSAWKKLSFEEINSGAFYTQRVLVYRDLPPALTGADTIPDICFDYDIFGLIGLHIIRRTEQFPYLLFTTFQHTGNYPNKFAYANTNPTANDGTSVSSTLPNAYGITYANPTDPQPTYDPKTKTVTSPSVPYLANRLVAPIAGVVTANQEAAALLKGTLLANYELVGVQTTPIEGTPQTIPPSFYTDGSVPIPGGTGEGYYPPYPYPQTFYLANPVIETNQRFQFFEGGFGASGIDNIALYPSGTVTKPVPPTINMGGCMGCHGNAQATGLSFTLDNVSRENPTSPYVGSNVVDQPVGTLKSICSEIGGSFVRFEDLNGCDLGQTPQN